MRASALHDDRPAVAFEGEERVAERAQEVAEHLGVAQAGEYAGKSDAHRSPAPKLGVLGQASGDDRSSRARAHEDEVG
jgi:hypothetical protein